MNLLPGWTKLARLTGRGLALTCMAALAAQLASASPHVLPLSEVRQDVSRTAGARQANQKAIDAFFSMPRVQKTLAASGMDAAKIRTSATLLDDREQAALAARAAGARESITGGEFTESQTTLVILAVAGFAYMTILILAFK